MRSAVTVTVTVLALHCGVLCTASFAQALKPLKPGQYAIGLNPTIQQICLKNDGTWFGTTFNFSGHWVNFPSNVSRVVGAIYGNYSIQGHEGSGYGNSAITISRPLHDRDLAADWYDWYDDMSYEAYVTGKLAIFENKECDPPFTGVNTHAATDSGG